MRASDPGAAILTVPPLLCIEILSKGQDLREIWERAEDYIRMGVEHVWAVDPSRRIAFCATSDGFRAVEDDFLRIGGTSIQIALHNLFAELDA